MPNLLAQLCDRRSEVSISIGDEDPATALYEYLEDGIVPVLFSDTIGGTELDMLVDSAEPPLRELKAGQRVGLIKLTGSLALDGVAVRAEVEVATDSLRGWGQLVAIERRGSNGVPGAYGS